MDDASTELMMGSGDSVMLNLGNAFFEIEEEEATEFCEEEVNKMQEIVDKLEEEESDILDEQKMNILFSTLFTFKKFISRLPLE